MQYFFNFRIRFRMESKVHPDTLWGSSHIESYLGFVHVKLSAFCKAAVVELLDRFLEAVIFCPDGKVGYSHHICDESQLLEEILRHCARAREETSAAGASGPQVPIKPRPKSKKMVTSDEDNESSAKSQSDDDKDSTGSMSGDEGSLDLQAERPLIISHDGNDDLLDFSDGHIPPVPHRHRSSSSIGSMGAPPDTDHDHDYDYDVKTSSGVDDLDEEEEEEEEHRPVMQKATKKKTAQQMKYEQEQPAVRSSRVIHAKAGSVKPKVSPESDWYLSTRIVFPATGGAIKLLEQNPLLKGVLKDSMALTVHDLAFVDFFPLMVSRESHASRTLRRVAREDQKTFQIQYRAKKDTKFCQRLGPLLFTRAGNVRTGLRNLSISTAATHYELNKTGLTASHIRSIVKQLITDQQYIFPFAAVPVEKGLVASDDASESATTFVTADVPITKPAKVAALKAFATDQPFQAPLIVDLIHETWWKGPKALGFKYIKELKSHRVDRPSEGRVTGSHGLRRWRLYLGVSIDPANWALCPYPRD
ncbi:hypothetical protein B0H14DRAFT_3128331 [Mycena olivaceomarginata]|nr:hypothetical protein B0H14DRAFT_3128331 [Mycena olivaceomarginata]